MLEQQLERGRVVRHHDEQLYVDCGARVITYDRPGYGGSTRQPGRRIADSVGDVAVLVALPVAAASESFSFLSNACLYAFISRLYRFLSTSASRVNSFMRYWSMLRQRAEMT